MIKEFALDGHEFIELNKLLKLLRLAGSGGEANQIITDGHVNVNGQVELQKRKKLRPGDKISYRNNDIQIIV